MALDPDACWTTQPVAVFDVETTGKEPDKCGVVSVAVARFVNGNCVERFYSLCNPRMEIPPESTDIHGVRDADVVNAPHLSDLAADLYIAAKDALPCGYNGMGYDRIVLHRHISGRDCPMFDPGWAWFDPLVVVRECDRWERGKGRHKLENVCKRHGVEFEGEMHNALTDAVATGRLVGRLLEKRLLKPCPVGKLLAHQEKVRARQEAEFKEWLYHKQQQDNVGDAYREYGK